LVAPEEEEQEDEEEAKPSEDEFEPVDDEKEPEEVEEFEGWDENAPDEITSSGFKTKTGEIPDYEPTVDEVLSYAMGKTKDPSQPAPTTMDVEMDDGDDLPEGIEETLDELIEEMDTSAADKEAEGSDDEDVPDLEGLDEAFGDEEDEDRE
jgi:hypothetical protein